MRHGPQILEDVYRPHLQEQSGGRGPLQCPPENEIERRRRIWITRARSAKGCGSTGTCRLRWRTVLCCVPMFIGRLRRGDIPVIMTYGPYGKWLAFQDGYVDQWRMMSEEHPDVTGRFDEPYQNWEVVDPEKWVPDGYVCVRVDSRGAGRSPGIYGSVVGAGDEGFLQLHRMGGRPALEQRQGRPERHFLLRDEPVAGGGHAAAASGGDLHLGGRRRLLSRVDPSRRHPFHLCRQLVRHAGQDGAARGGEAGVPQRHGGRLGGRPGDADAGGARGEPLPISARTFSPIL